MAEVEGQGTGGQRVPRQRNQRSPRRRHRAGRQRLSRVSSRRPRTGVPRNIPRFWLLLAAVPLLAVLGIIIHIVTNDGTVKITGTAPNVQRGSTRARAPVAE